MNKNKLVEILKIQSESYNQFRMFAYIIRELKKLNVYYYTYNGCIYAQKGNADTFPCVVSHMDTVHDIVEDLTPIEINGNITGFNSCTMEQTGIGGDDKVGIFIALECISKFKNIKAVFFRDEEIGCVGSYRPDINFFTDCSFILQCDRRGNSDFITNASGIELSSSKFQNDISPIISKYGYKFNNGAMTDVMALKQCKINISMANISCGYYNPHSPQEYVNIKDVENTLNLVEEIIQNIGHIKYIHEHKEKTYTYKHKKYKYDLFDNYNIKSTKSICDMCFQNNEVDSIVYSREYDMNICTKCTEDYSISCR
jgi:tripeptide aminopeptidase